MPLIVSVIDDDASVRNATNNVLTSRGFTVQTFASAEEFLGSTDLSETACVIADVQMPLMSGLDLLMNMRFLGYNAPVIFVTAFTDERIRSQALKAGAVCLLAKPFAVATLLKCIDIALKGSRAI